MLHDVICYRMSLDDDTYDKDAIIVNIDECKSQDDDNDIQVGVGDEDNLDMKRQLTAYP